MRMRRAARSKERERASTLQNTVEGHGGKKVEG